MIYNIVFKNHVRQIVKADYCTYNPTGNYYLFVKNRKGVYYVDRKDMECIYIDKENYNERP